MSLEILVFVYLLELFSFLFLFARLIRPPDDCLDTFVLYFISFNNFDFHLRPRRLLDFERKKKPLRREYILWDALHSSDALSNRYHIEFNLKLIRHFSRSNLLFCFFLLFRSQISMRLCDKIQIMKYKTN